MTSIHPAEAPMPFDELLAKLKSFPAPLLAPDTTQDPSLSDSIASLFLHPAIEALFHIMNHDLPSAHFLVRHMQSPPAYEGMYVHGILHRIEGDFNNARAWYSDVGEWEGFSRFWGAVDAAGEENGQKLPRQKSAREFLDRVENGAKSGVKDEDVESLRSKSRDEVEDLLDWCLKRVGKDMHKDATKVWAQPSEEISKIGEEQVSGSGGPRKF
ncbi:hypothetical protein BST61_g9518 [Cercospora zeina]